VSWKEAKKSLQVKICDGPVFHLGTTGNNDISPFSNRTWLLPVLFLLKKK
jgi:hypothetical protein